MTNTGKDKKKMNGITDCKTTDKKNETEWQPQLHFQAISLPSKIRKIIRY